MLTTNSVTPTRAHMNVTYSRLAQSNEDYQAFFGYNPDERDIPRTSYTFDLMIAAELDSLHPLPSPFTTAYSHCIARERVLSQKQHLAGVRVGLGDLTTDHFKGAVSMPTVLIGDAAHAIPRNYSVGSINWAMMDAVDLCSMIVQRYDDDESFSRISRDFYNLKYRTWLELGRDWEESWSTAHDLPYDYRQARYDWVKLRRTHPLVDTGIPDEKEFDHLPEDEKRNLLRYRKREASRWDEIQQRIRDRYERRNAFETPPRVEPTGVVLLYYKTKEGESEDISNKQRKSSDRPTQEASHSARDETNRNWPANLTPDKM